MLSALLRISGLLLLFVLAFEASAQTVPDWAQSSEGTAMQAQGTENMAAGGGPPAPPPAPPPVPIDGGLALLALAGGAYAVRRLRNNQKEGNKIDD